MGKPLPPELLLCIFEFARRIRAVGALASAARASHTFNALVTPLLYHTLVITSQNYTALLRASSQTAFHDRAQLVHDLVIEPRVQSDVSRFCRPAEELEDLLASFPNATTYAIGRLNFWPQISYELTSLSTTHAGIAWCLSRTPHLVHLQFTRVIEMLTESFLNGLIMDDLSQLTSLRTISLHFEHPARCAWASFFSSASEQFADDAMADLAAFVRTLLRIPTLKRLLVLAPGWQRGAANIPDKVQRVYEWTWLQDFRDPRIHFALLPSALADVPFGPWIEGILGPTPLEEWGEQVWQDESSVIQTIECADERARCRR